MKKSIFPLEAFFMVVLSLAASVIMTGCGPQFGQYAELRHRRLTGFLGSSDGILAPRLPVVFIPGIKGSKLVRCKKQWADKWACSPNEETEVWGTSGNVLYLETFDDLLLHFNCFGEPGEQPLLGETIPSPDCYKRHGIKAQDVLFSYSISFYKSFGGFRLDQKIYEHLREFLRGQGYYRDAELNKDGDRGENLFFLPYDWRLDNRIAAVKLAMMLEHYRNQYMKFVLLEFCAQNKTPTCKEGDSEFQIYWNKVQETFPHLFTNGKIKFILVGHSMGGLVAKYFVAALNDQDVYKLIMLGTPLFGSVETLRAFRDGDFPETLLGEILQIRFFSKGMARPIELSMSSLFQLLPTYKGSVLGTEPDPVSLKSLGLDMDVPLTTLDFEDRKDNPIFQTYHRYGFIPGHFRVQKFRALKDIDSDDKSTQVFRRHFLLNLKSAQCLHRFMRGGPSLPLEDQEICKEHERIRAAAKFLQRTHDELVEARPPSPRFETRPASAEKVKTIIFSGHCHTTLVRAYFKDNNEVDFSDDPDVPESTETEASGQRPQELGDERVSIFSTGILLGNTSDLHFIICETHTGLVSNDVFQYNLLRELLIN